MATTAILALLCLALPLAAFFVVFTGARQRHGLGSFIVVASGLGTAICTVALALAGDSQAHDVHHSWHWLTLHTGSSAHSVATSLEFGFLLDSRAVLMGAIVGIITLCVQIYSLSYMKADPGRSRFFAFLALFEWAMLSFVYSPNLLQTFIFWELVGLASFLLIGFWYQKPEAVAAAKKAFLMTRIGDVGFLVGLILLYKAAGTLDVRGIAEAIQNGGAAAWPIETITLLLFVGIIGKSAQFPLHTWLPNAMEGPTPVSALLHSATMVAAGVFLYARFFELFAQAELTRDIVLGIAAFTAVFAATMALVASDIKRVFAYSSISQLGFMLMGLAAGSLFAGFFHLVTHAFFKALLFLCAGSLIHYAGTNDVVAIGRAGGRQRRLTTLGLCAGGAALAGIPFFAGFWSKEAILHELSGPVLAAAYAGSFLTAYYSFRVIFLVLRPRDDSDATVHQQAHIHGSPKEDVPTGIPIAVLTLAAMTVGFAGNWLAGRLGVPHADIPFSAMLPAIAIALGGALLAYYDFGRSQARQLGFAERSRGVRRLLANGWYIDRLYRAVFVGMANGIAKLLYRTEIYGFDGGSDNLGANTTRAGSAMAKSQNGRLQFYIGFAVVTIAVITLVIGVYA